MVAMPLCIVSNGDGTSKLGAVHVSTSAFLAK